MIRSILDGKTGATRDIVVVNAAAALVVADIAEDLRDGMQIAAAAIDDGSAKKTLQDLVEVTNA